MIARLLLLLFLLLPVSASAQPTLASTFLEGSWALRLEGSIIMRFDLELTDDAWTGTWVKPGSFASDGRRFGSIKMPAVERTAESGRAIGEWAELAFPSDDGEGAGDVFRFRLVSGNRAEMVYVGTGLPPYTLQRVAAGALLGPFEEGRAYGGESGSGTAPPLPPMNATPQREPEREEAPVQGPPAMIGR